MADQPITIFHLEIPLRWPFATSGGSIASRSTALVRFGEGPFGWGEAAPYPRQDEAFELVLHAARVGERTPALRAAIDEAAADFQARLLDEPLARALGETQDVIPASLAVGLSDPMGVVENAVSRGVRRFKVKIASGRIDHVMEIRDRHADIVIGVDANGSFDSQSVGELQVLNHADIAYLEQPVADPASDTARRVAEIVEPPVFVDESVRFSVDAEAFLDLDHVDGVVVKPGRLGWAAAVTVRAIANSKGRLWRASGLLETGIGRAYTDILAACPDAFISDVAPADWFLESDITASRYFDGKIAVPTASGLGVSPDPELLARYEISRFELP